MKLAKAKFIAELSGTTDIDEQKKWLYKIGIKREQILIGLDGKPKVAEALIERIMLGEQKEKGRKRTEPNRDAFRDLSAAHA